MAGLPYPIEPEQQSQDIDPMNPASVAPVMDTSLKLTDTQEENLTSKILYRIDELRYDMGLITGITGGSPGAASRFFGSQFVRRKDEYYLATAGEVTTTGWMWERECNQHQYDNDWYWRRALGGIFHYCIAPDTLVLTTDLTWKRADEIAAGEELIGCDEESPTSKHVIERRHWKTGLVHKARLGGGQRKFRRSAVVQAKETIRAVSRNHHGRWNDQVFN